MQVVLPAAANATKYTLSRRMIHQKSGAHLLDNLLRQFVDHPRKSESGKCHSEVLALLPVVYALVDLLDRQRLKSIGNAFGDGDSEGVEDASGGVSARDLGEFREIGWDGEGGGRKFWSVGGVY